MRPAQRGGSRWAAVSSPALSTVRVGATRFSLRVSGLDSAHGHAGQAVDDRYPCADTLPIGKRAGAHRFPGRQPGREGRLGWRVDTVGRGFSDRLQAHSCKPDNGNPHGSDVRSCFDAGSQQIASASFANKCATLPRAAAPGVRLGAVGLRTRGRCPGVHLRRRHRCVSSRRECRAVSGGGTDEQDGRPVHVARTQPRGVQRHRCQPPPLAAQRERPREVEV